MSALHKLKAYFGMVPADEVDEYGDVYRDRYAEEPDDFEPGDRIGRRRFGGGVRGGYQAEVDDGDEDYGAPAPRRSFGGEAPPPRGSMGSESRREPVTQLRAVTDTGSHVNLSKITTLHPRSFGEARTIGEQYRDGTPVIINLTEMDEADARRLVDFAAGLAFALRGSIDKVTNRVFLLSPPNIDVAAEDKRRLAEGALFNYG